MEKVRLSKVMASRGLCSRREADELIARGWVQVDGVPVQTLGFKIFPQQTITLLRVAETQLQQAVTVVLNKPVGMVSAQAERNYIPAITLITPEHHFAGDRSGIDYSPAHKKGLAPAGRLDIDSQGLLVFTQDGRIARQLVGKDSLIEKEYIVRVEGVVNQAALAKLRHGLILDSNPLKPAQVEQIRPQILRFILHEGRKRQIRRMSDLVGLKVVSLKRVRIGAIVLGALPVGFWRYLRPDEHF